MTDYRNGESMKRLNLLRQLALSAAVIALVAGVACATAKTGAKKKLTGQELYALNCNRCHAERYATERTPGQWKTLLLHMRVRANLPADQAKAILKYLQEDAGK